MKEQIKNKINYLAMLRDHVKQFAKADGNSIEKYFYGLTNKYDQQIQELNDTLPKRKRIPNRK